MTKIDENNNSKAKTKECRKIGDQLCNKLKNQASRPRHKLRGHEVCKLQTKFHCKLKLVIQNLEMCNFNGLVLKRK